jgi:hypothetical protein
LSPRGALIQYWDTSALISIVFQERHTSAALQARDEGRRWLAWTWIQIEAHSALARRGGRPADFKSLHAILEQFEFISFGTEEYPALRKLLDRHRLRSADAGHLFCLIKAKKLVPELQFVCFDDELTKAAKTEGIKVFG